MNFIKTTWIVLFLFLDFSYAKSVQIPIGDILGGAISKTAPKLKAHSTSSSDVLSIDELRICIADKEKLDVESAKINNQEKEIIRKENQLLTAQKEHNELGNKAYTSEQINALNAKITDNNEKIALLKQGHDMVIFKVDNHNKKVNEFQLKCGKKNYYIEDYDKIMAEKRK